MLIAQSSDIEACEAELLGQALSLLQSGMSLLERSQAHLAAAHLDASILDVQSRLTELNNSL